MMISGNKTYLIKKAEEFTESGEDKTPEELEEEEFAKATNKNENNVHAEKSEKKVPISKTRKVINTLKDHLENFTYDESSSLKGKYAIMNTQTKLWPLHEMFTLKKFFGLGFKSTFPLMSLRNYFGPKIALYFFFVGFMINRLYIIGIIGILSMVLYSVSDMMIKYVFEGNQDPTDPDYDLHSYLSMFNDLIIWGFSIYLFIWGFRFARDWEVNEKIFQINNGDVDENRGNIKDEERVKIKEYHYTRSLITDELNTKSTNEPKMQCKFVLVLLITILLGLLCLGLSIQILEVKNIVVKKLHIDDVVYMDQQIGTNLVIFKLIPSEHCGSDQDPNDGLDVLVPQHRLSQMGGSN
jgi:hypothetical protein